jgi:hypothetical protein
MFTHLWYLLNLTGKKLISKDANVISYNECNLEISKKNP